ncbi:MAG TPA: Smr/MutS family protein [Kofleriaceae bacterium]|nr:Smr/MutS family protein [Kofleriaceae bacterium]
MLGWLRRWRAARAAEDEAAEDDAAEDDAADADTGAEDAPLSDELDLHTFLPQECADVVEEYVRAAQEAGLQAVRIIHGKGKGTLRRTVHAVLDRHPAVRAYRLAGAERGSWGATLVELKPPT